MTSGSILMTSVPHSFKAVLNLAAVLSLGNTSGLAANISLSPLDNDPAHALVAVDGPFEAGDESKFRTEVGRLTKAVVVFNSDGGNLQAGIEIGKTIRLKSFATTVLDGSRCASSCAFAWLGGSPRFMERGAQIGFHAAYIKKEGLPSESGVGNALVGSYLTQIGLSEIAVVYITKAAPTQLTLLTLQDAERIGIEVLPFEQHAPTTEPAQRITPRDHQELSKRALSFVNEIHSRWSETNAAGLAWLDPLYADEVNFYGNTISRAEVLTEKRLFTERWPERNYRIQPKSMNAVCDESRPGLTQSMECIVTGTVEWQTRSPARNATASGLAGFTYVLGASGGTFLIKGEHGSAPQPPPSTQKRDAQVHIQVQVIEDLQLREQPDPRARNILGAPPNDKMPKGSQVAVIDTCRTWMGSGRGAQDADNIWCPVLYEGHRGWANAYYLADHGGRVACVMYPPAGGCASTGGR
jgi:hypothetical protein